MVSSVGGRPLFLGDEDDEDEDALHPRAAGPPVAGTSARPSSSTALPQLSVQGSVAAPASSPSQLGKKPPSDHSRSFDNAASQGLYDDFLALDRTITPLPLAPPPTHLLALLPQAVPLLSLGNFVQLVASDTAVPLVPELSGSPGQSLLQRRIDLARLGEAPFREGLSGGVERYQIALEDLSPRGRAELQERMERTELTGEVTVPTWNAATNSFNSLSHTLPFLNRLNPGDAVIQASKHHPSRYHTAMIYHTRSSLARLLASSALESAVPLGPELSISPIRSLLGGLETLPFLATKRRFRIPSCAVGAAVPRIGDTLAWIEMLQLVQPSGNTKGRNSYTIGLVRQNTGAGVIAPSALLASWPAAFGPPCDESRALLEDFLAATEEINHLAGEMVAAFLELGLLPEEKQSSTFQHHRRGSPTGGNPNNIYTSTMQVNVTVCPASAISAADSSSSTSLRASLGISFGATHSDPLDDPTRHTVLLPLGLLPLNSHGGSFHHLETGTYVEFDPADPGLFAFRGVDSHVGTSATLAPAYAPNLDHVFARCVGVAYPFALANTADPPVAIDAPSLVLNRGVVRAGASSLPLLADRPPPASAGSPLARDLLVLVSRARRAFTDHIIARFRQRHGVGGTAAYNPLALADLRREVVVETTQQLAKLGRDWASEVRLQAAMLELDLADARVEPAISAIAARGHPFAPDGSPALGSACPSLNDYDVAELRSAEVESIALARVTSKRSMGGVGTSSARGTLYVRLRGWEPTRTKIKCVGGVSETVGVGWTVASNRSTPIAPPVPPLRLDGTISPIFPLHLRDLHNEVSLSELDAYRSSLERVSTLPSDQELLPVIGPSYSTLVPSTARSLSAFRPSLPTLSIHEGRLYAKAIDPAALSRAERSSATSHASRQSRPGASRSATGRSAPTSSSASAPSARRSGQPASKATSAQGPVLDEHGRELFAVAPVSAAREPETLASRVAQRVSTDLVTFSQSFSFSPALAHEVLPHGALTALAGTMSAIADAVTASRPVFDTSATDSRGLSKLVSLAGQLSPLVVVSSSTTYDTLSAVERAVALDTLATLGDVMLASWPVLRALAATAERMAEVSHTELTSSVDPDWLSRMRQHLRKSPSDPPTAFHLPANFASSSSSHQGSSSSSRQTFLLPPHDLPIRAGTASFVPAATVVLSHLLLASLAAPTHAVDTSDSSLFPPPSSGSSAPDAAPLAGPVLAAQSAAAASLLHELGRLHSQVFLAVASRRAFGSSVIFLCADFSRLVLRPDSYLSDTMRPLRASKGSAIAPSTAAGWEGGFLDAARRPEVKEAVAGLVTACAETVFAVVLAHPPPLSPGSPASSAPADTPATPAAAAAAGRYPIWSESRVAPAARVPAKRNAPSDGQAPLGRREGSKRRKGAGTVTSAVPAKEPRRVPLPPIDTPFEPIAWHRQQHVSTATLLATSTYPLSLSSTAVTSLATTPDLAFCHLGIENEGSPASVPPAHVVARAKLDQARENGVSLNTIADLEKKVTGLGDTLSAAADFGYQQRLAWLNLYLLASLVHLGITKLSSSEFGNNEAVFSLFTRVVHKFHELPDKLLWARNRGPGRVLFASTLHSSLTPAPVKVALMSLVRGTLLGSTPHMYRLLADAAVPTTYWTFRNFLRDPAVSARRGDAVHRSDLGNPTVYGSGTKITYNFAPQYYLSAPGLARALGFQHPATSPPKAAAPAATSSTAHLPPSQLAPPPSPLLSYSEALKIIECGFLGLTGEIELFSSSATQAYKAAQGKKGHAPWEAAPPDGDETLEWEHERYQSGRDSFGNAWALPQIKGDLTSTLLAADFAYAGLCQMPTKAEYAARILALGKGGYRGLVELGFIASAGANAFESFVTHMRASWADGGMHSSVKQALAANDVHLDLPHLEHLLCKIGRPEWLAFLKDADFPLLLKLAPCIINLSAPTWAVHLAAANV